MTLCKSFPLSGPVCSGEWVPSMSGCREHAASWQDLAPAHVSSPFPNSMRAGRRWDPLESDQSAHPRPPLLDQKHLREKGASDQGILLKKKKQLFNRIITVQVSKSVAIIWHISSLSAQAVSTWEYVGNMQGICSHLCPNPDLGQISLVLDLPIQDLSFLAVILQSPLKRQLFSAWELCTIYNHKFIFFLSSYFQNQI